MRIARAAVGSVAALALALGGCSSDGPDGPDAPPSPQSGSTAGVTAPSSSRSPSSSEKSSGRSSTSASGSSAGTVTAAARVLARMSLRERVGQLIMIDCPSTGVSDATRTAITRYAVGSVILDGTSTAGVAATAAVTRTLRGLAPDDAAGLFIATDQEGGLVQRLQGPGFDRIPSGNEQGLITPATLQGNARTWGTQLRAAGVNVNLAPVLDTVPSGGAANPPIGDLDRQYGSSPQTVTSHGLAYARGMSAAGVDPVVKHFPGLGRVTGNTDTTGGVTDPVTTADDPYLAPFRAAVRAGVPFVMMSTAIYSRLDPGVPAAFSSRIVTDLLRKDIGFDGVVVSDDIGAARQVSTLSAGERAVRFVRAGGDLVLTVVADQAGPMTSALESRARSDPAFRTLVDAAALRVLSAKAARGLL